LEDELTVYVVSGMMEVTVDKDRSCPWNEREDAGGDDVQKCVALITELETRFETDLFYRVHARYSAVLEEWSDLERRLDMACDRYHVQETLDWMESFLKKIVQGVISGKDDRKLLDDKAHYLRRFYGEFLDKDELCRKILEGLEREILDVFREDKTSVECERTCVSCFLKGLQCMPSHVGGYWVEIPCRR
jgi:hypothetical protein